MYLIGTNFRDHLIFRNWKRHISRDLIFAIWQKSRVKGPLKYLVAMSSSANFSRAFWPPGAGPSPVQVADNFFISLRQTQKKLFCLLFKLILIFFFTFTTCELCLYFLNWVFQLKMSSKLYPRTHVNRKRSDGCKSMGKCASRKAAIQRFSVSGRG